MRTRTASLVACLSGFVALGYEILWARRLSDIIGATAYASSLVVGVFFLALAAGAAWLGPRAARHASPWRLYGMLELGILAAILPSFFGEQLASILSRALGPLLLGGAGGALVKSGLALVFVGPPAFLMGGTLPALGQAVVRPDRLGREGNLIYGANTLGGAAGIVVATFLLLPSLGVRATFLVLMAGSFGLALAAWRLARTAPAPNAVHSRGARSSSAGGASARNPSPRSPFTPWEILAGISGFTVLGMEVLSLHLFGQVLHNSGYTFATVLVVVIAALALGALVTQRWTLDPEAARRRLAWALLLAACAAAVLPRFFYAITGGMSPFGGSTAGITTGVLRALGEAGLAAYIVGIVTVAAIVIGPLFVFAGWVFPLVLAGAGAGSGSRKAVPGSAAPGGTATVGGRTGPAPGTSGPARTDPETTAVGARWGRLLGTNAAGALLGLALANHVAMPLLGLWGSITAWCVVLIAAGLWVALPARGRSRAGALALGIVAVTLLLATAPWTLPVAHLSPGERLVAWRGGADGITAVLEGAEGLGDRRIKYNNTYSLGGTGNAAQQARMGYLPLLLHPRPQRTAFMGMATGITASAALHDPQVQSLTALELSPEIAHLACEHFADANDAVCTSPRARVVVEDGRMFFRATREMYDVVVGDLFVPWQSGTANLYTREQFEAVRRHLRPGGLFAQWLPLFQLDATGFWGIAATFCAVFPNAWLAIVDYQPQYPGVALIGWAEAGGAPDMSILERRCAELGAQPALREPMLCDPAGAATFLVGPVAPALPPDVPLLQLDRPWLADHAPRVQRARPPHYFVGPELVASLARIASRVPDGPLQQPILLGRQLYEFCDVFDREGPQRAAAWFERNVTAPLPERIFLVPRPEQMSWPFTQATGMFLIQRAHAQAMAQKRAEPAPGSGRIDSPGESR